MNPRGDLNPVLGVLNLIDSARDWPVRLDAAGVEDLHATAGRWLARLRDHLAAKTPQELARPWLPELSPGLTPELLHASSVAAARPFVAAVAQAAGLYGPADRALELVILAGMACRNAWVPFDRPGPLYEALEQWEERLVHAAAWSMAALPAAPPSAARLKELFIDTGWTIVSAAGGPDRAGRPTLFARFVAPRLAPQPYRQEAVGQDEIVVRGTSAPAEPFEFAVNGHTMTWRQLCEAMTCGQWLPASHTRPDPNSSANADTDADRPHSRP